MITTDVLKIKISGKVFDQPRIIFTLHYNTMSVKVLAALQECLGELDGSVPLPEIKVFDSQSEVSAYFEGGVSPLTGVALFDASVGGDFHPTTPFGRPEDARRIPSWTWGASWVVMVNPNRCRPRTCALQVRADFVREFQKRITTAEFVHDGKSYGMFPWGSARQGEKTLQMIALPPNMEEVVRKLNSGPDLAAAIADMTFAAELPTGSRISWLRVAPEPVCCDGATLRKIMQAFQYFEQACDKLARESADIQRMLLQGVDLNPTSEAAKLYLLPPRDHFSVRRPDLHYAEGGLFSSENDEMPGGWPELYHIDCVYGVNQERWRRCFEWLTAEGPLLFVVSHRWSECYIPETEWLVDKLTEQGYLVRILTTDRLDEIEITDRGVFHRGDKVGTTWRQFPIFETTGKLVDLVRAAHIGLVRMVPEFAHFGNKVWFSIFRTHAEFFEQTFAGASLLDVFQTLDQILPDSYLIASPDSFPCRVAGQTIPDLVALRDLPEEARNDLVLKMSGANDMTARSHGVLMGHGLKESDWRDWIDKRVRLQQPFIIQQRLPTSVARIPVKHTGLNAPELFSCRILLRPWTVGGELVSVSGIAVPSNTLRVHGRVDMAVVPVIFD